MPEEDIPSDGSGRLLDLTEVVAGLRAALGECSLDYIEDELPQRKNILTLVSAVSDAGIDGEALVRYGCAYDIAVPLAIALAVDTLDGRSLQGREWSEALGIGTVLASKCDSDGNKAIGQLASNVVPTLLRWVYTAPLSDIITLTRPSPDVDRQVIPPGCLSCNSATGGPRV